MSSTSTHSQFCTATPISVLVQCHISFRLLPSDIYIDFSQIKITYPTLSVVFGRILKKYSSLKDYRFKLSGKICRLSIYAIYIHHFGVIF